MLKNLSPGARLALKGALIFIITLLLMIPALMIGILISEREDRQEEAIREIGSKWAIAQDLTGPVLSIPYYEYRKDIHGGTKELHYAHFLPEKLDVTGKVKPEKRYRGIYEVVVYSSDLKFQGLFEKPDIKGLGIDSAAVLWEDAFLSVGLSDLRGIEKMVRLSWNGREGIFNPGIPSSDISHEGLSVPVSMKNDTSGKYSFSFDLALRGSDRLYFVPLGKETDVHLASAWKDPAFDGSFLPDSRVVTDSGFNAAWNVLHLNRNFPQSWKGDRYHVYDSSFGVNLIVPVDHFQKAMRSVKYAFLLIGLTFLVFFFVEHYYKKSVHPLQYLLIGLALVVFYTLLVAVAEQTNFNFAYILGALLTVGLIAAYSYTIFRDKRMTLLTAGILALLYGFMFTLIQMQDYSLLIGSFGLFLILALVMFYSRKIRWGGKEE